MDINTANPLSGTMNPSDPPQTPDPLASQGAEDIVKDVYTKYDQWRQARRPFEIQWYINASALRGFPDVRFNAELNRLEVKREPKHRQRLRINHIKPKYVARVAKYTKNPPTPSVIPATTDREDVMNARASQKALEYAVRKYNLRAKYMQVMQWVPITGKAFWWIRWDDDAVSQTLLEGVPQPVLGDVAVDVGTAFEVLVGDPSLENIGDQPEIIRAKMVPLESLKNKYPGIEINGEGSDNDLFFYQKQIADLGTRQQGLAARSTARDEEAKTHVLRIELFTKPCDEFPNGRYVVCAGQKLLRNEPVLPGDFHYITKNPYPVVEFCDDAAPGQFWPDAFIERLVGLQSEYNQYRSQLKEHMTLMFFPKMLVPQQANIAPDAYNSEAGEKIEYTWLPNMPPVSFLSPANVLGDVWNMLQLVRKEMDDVSLIYPSSIGGAGGSNSGFQTNLLQEAADQVHGPAIQRNAYGLEDAFYKIRHLMKVFYDVPRLISVAGKTNIPEVLEFQNSQIDENADIVVEADSMMPMLKSARIDMIRQMYLDGIWGNPQDPATVKKVRDMLRMSDADFEMDRDARDEEQAQLENVMMTRGQSLGKPQPWENHMVHWDAHTDLFKSPEAQNWNPQQWLANVWHALVHLNYINPQNALMMAGEFGLAPQLAQLQQMQMMGAQQGVPAAPAGALPVGQAPDPNGGPTGQPPAPPMGGMGQGPIGTPPEQGLEQGNQIPSSPDGQLPPSPQGQL